MRRSEFRNEDGSISWFDVGCWVVFFGGPIALGIWAALGTR